jgi:cytochrome bd-type quinol oxidase subunit 2
MAEAVYVLCGVTSGACAALLWRRYRQSRLRLLLWGALCFAGLTLNSALLFYDLVVVPDVDLAVLRSSVAVLALSLLVFGLVWDSK